VTLTLDRVDVCVRLSVRPQSFFPISV